MWWETLTSPMKSWEGSNVLLSSLQNRKICICSIMLVFYFVPQFVCALTIVGVGWRKDVLWKGEKNSWLVNNFWQGQVRIKAGGGALISNPAECCPLPVKPELGLVYLSLLIVLTQKSYHSPVIIPGAPLSPWASGTINQNANYFFFAASTKTRNLGVVC